MMQKGIRSIFLVPACILLAFLIYFKAFLGPVQEKIQNDERGILTLQPSMASVQSITDEVNSLSAGLNDLKTKLQDKKTNLPDALDPYDIILLLSEIDQTAVVRNSLIFLEPLEQEDFTILPVRLHFAANYDGFLRLLTFLNSLSPMPSVSNMQISSAGENVHNSMDETGKVIYNLDVEMTLNFYIERN